MELLLVWPIILNFLLDYLSLIVARSGVASVYQKGGALAFLKGPVVNLFQTTVLIAAVGVIAAFVSYAVGFAANFPPPYYALSLGENLALAGRVIWSGLFFWRSDASPTLSIGMVHVVSPYVATLWLWLMTIAASLTMGLVRILRVVSRSINVDRNHIIRVMMGVAVTVFSLAFWGVQMVESL